jgi:hypothetical protein
MPQKSHMPLVFHLFGSRWHFSLFPTLTQDYSIINFYYSPML